MTTIAARWRQSLFSTAWLARIGSELDQAFIILMQDVRTYYLSTPMIMWGLLMPFFLFLPLMVQQDVSLDAGMAALLAMTTFLTASSTGPVIIPLERRAHTYERLLAAPMSLITVLIGKSLVGIFFGVVVSLIPLVAAVLFFRVTVMYPLILLAAVALSSAAFSTLGVLFASGSAQSPGAVMMPSLLLRWPLLFLSGVFIPLNQMPSWLRLISNLSPLTYAQDLLNYAIVGKSADITQIFKPCGKIVDVVNIMSGGIQTPLVDVAMLVFLIVIFFIPAVRLQNRMRKLGA